MNPPEMSHPGQGNHEVFKKLNEGGATIIQVTHSETNAAYGHWIINIVDGWISTD